MGMPGDQLPDVFDPNSAESQQNWERFMQQRADFLDGVRTRLRIRDRLMSDPFAAFSTSEDANKLLLDERESLLLNAAIDRAFRQDEPMPLNQYQLTNAQLNDIIGEAEAYGIADPTSYDPMALEALVEQRRAAIRADQPLTDDPMLMLSLTAPFEAVMDVAQSVPFLGDILARQEWFNEADQWFSTMKEYTRASITEDQEGLWRVNNTLSGMVGYAVPAVAAWMAVGAAVPAIAASGLAPFMKYGIQGLLAGALIEGGGDAPIGERALNIGLEGLFAATAGAGRMVEAGIAGSALGGLIGYQMDESLEGGVAGAAVGATLGLALPLVLTKAQRSFRSRVLEPEPAFAARPTNILEEGIREADFEIISGQLPPGPQPPASGGGGGTEIGTFEPAGLLNPGPPRARPVEVLPSSVVMGQQLTPQMGSNLGGVYQGMDGVTRYVKLYDDPIQTLGEALANRIYNDLGIAAPKSTIVNENGAIYHAGEVMPVAGIVGDAGLTPEVADQVLGGFAADVLVANWDVVGLNTDNLVVLSDGTVARVDQGGAFLMRAQAGRKPENVLNDITEWGGLADFNVNPSYARVFAAADKGYPEDLGMALVEQINKIEALRSRHGGWANYVDQLNLPFEGSSSRSTMISMLEARTDKLLAKREALRNQLPDLPISSYAPVKGMDTSPTTGLPVEPPDDIDALMNLLGEDGKLGMKIMAEEGATLTKHQMFVNSITAPELAAKSVFSDVDLYKITSDLMGPGDTAVIPGVGVDSYDAILNAKLSGEDKGYLVGVAWYDGAEALVIADGGAKLDRARKQYEATGLIERQFALHDGKIVRVKTIDPLNPEKVVISAEDYSFQMAVSTSEIQPIDYLAKDSYYKDTYEKFKKYAMDQFSSELGDAIPPSYWTSADVHSQLPRYFVEYHKGATPSSVPGMLEAFSELYVNDLKKLAPDEWNAAMQAAADATTLSNMADKTPVSVEELADEKGFEVEVWAPVISRSVTDYDNAVPRLDWSQVPEEVRDYMPQTNYFNREDLEEFVSMNPDPDALSPEQLAIGRLFIQEQNQFIVNSVLPATDFRVFRSIGGWLGRHNMGTSLDKDTAITFAKTRGSGIIDTALNRDEVVLDVEGFAHRFGKYKAHEERELLTPNEGLYAVRIGAYRTNTHTYNHTIHAELEFDGEKFFLSEAKPTKQTLRKDTYVGHPSIEPLKDAPSVKILFAANGDPVAFESGGEVFFYPDAQPGVPRPETEFYASAHGGPKNPTKLATKGEFIQASLAAEADWQSQLLLDRLEDIMQAMTQPRRGRFGLLKDRLSDLRVPVDTEAEAKTFLRNFKRPLPDLDTPSMDIPSEILALPPGAETPLEGVDGTWRDTGHMTDAVEAEVRAYEEWDRARTANFLRGQGIDPPPPPPPGGNTPPAVPDDFRREVVGPLFDESVGSQFKRLMKDNPLRLAQALMKMDSFVLKWVEPMRNWTLEVQQILQNDLGIEAGRLWEHYADVSNGLGRAHNEMIPWMEEWANIVGGFRRKYRRDGTVTRIEQIANWNDKLRAMQEAGYTAKEMEAQARIRPFFDSAWGEARQTDPNIGYIFDYLPALRRLQNVGAQQDPFMRWEKDSLPNDWKWFARYARSYGVQARHADIGTLGTVYVRGLFFEKNVAPSWQKMADVWTDPRIPEALRAPVQGWLDLVLTGQSPQNDVFVTGVRHFLNKVGLPITDSEVRQLWGGMFGTMYRAGLGLSPHHLFRDSIQPYFVGTELGFKWVNQSYLKWLRGSEADRVAMIRRAEDWGYVERGQTQVALSEVFSQPGTLNSGESVFTPGQQAFRETIAQAMDKIYDISPNATKQGMQGTIVDPLLAYTKLGEFNRIISGEAGFLKASDAINSYLKGEIHPRDLLAESGASFYPKPIQDRFQYHVENQEFNEAIKLLAQEAANSQFRYGLKEQSIGVQGAGMLGKMGMMFGTFTTQYVARMRNGLNGALRGRPEAVKFAARQVLMWSAIGAAASYTGWKGLHRWKWHRSLAFGGGPLAGLGVKAAQAIPGAINTAFGENPTPEQESAMAQFGIRSPLETLNPYAGGIRTAQGIAAGLTSPDPFYSTAQFITTGEQGAGRYFKHQFDDVLPARWGDLRGQTAQEAQSLGQPPLNQAFDGSKSVDDLLNSIMQERANPGGGSRF